MNTLYIYNLKHLAESDAKALIFNESFAIFQALHIEPDFENLSIDSTSVKAHQHSVGAQAIQSFSILFELEPS